MTDKIIDELGSRGMDLKLQTYSYPVPPHSLADMGTFITTQEQATRELTAAIRQLIEALAK